jgi:hypothetical protein
VGEFFDRFLSKKLHFDLKMDQNTCDPSTYPHQPGRNAMNNDLSRISYGLVLMFGCAIGVVAISLPAITQAQRVIIQEEGPLPNLQIQDEQPPTATDDTKKADDEDSNVTDTVSADEETIGDQFVRFHMWDGSIVAGDVVVEGISVRTEFGTLQIPISQINRFYPGLDSFPELNAKIEGLVEGLGDKDFDVREKSHRALASMGMQLRYQISQFDDQGSAERKKRLAELRKEIDELVDSLEEEGEDTEKALIRGDTIETPGFTIVGKIELDTFAIQTKFGPLTVPLSDIKMADRTFQKAKNEIRKTVDVDAEAFFQRQPVSTKIRVNKGDKISIKGEGIVQWTNWSTSSGPDGLANQGQYMGITSGTLCARIGTNGKPIKIGTKEDFVASSTGVLYLAIAIQDNYVNQQGYRWTGGYKAKIQVKPAPNK